MWLNTFYKLKCYINKKYKKIKTCDVSLSGSETMTVCWWIFEAFIIDLTLVLDTFGIHPNEFFQIECLAIIIIFKKKATSI